MFLSPFIEVFGSVLIGALLGLILSKLANKFDRLRDDMQVLALLTVFMTVSLTSIVNHYLHDYGIGFSQLLINIAVGSMVANVAKKPERSYGALNDMTTPFLYHLLHISGCKPDLSLLGADSLILIMLDDIVNATISCFSFRI